MLENYKPTKTEVFWRRTKIFAKAQISAFVGGLFFTSKDAVSFCSFEAPELGRKITIDDPDRLLLNQILLEPVVQFYLDAPHMGAVRAHPEFLYGEDRVTPFAAQSATGQRRFTPPNSTGTSNLFKFR